MQAKAALGMGVSMALEVRADRLGLPAAAAQARAQALGSPCHSAEFARLNNRVREATAWLQAAMNAGHGFAQLHLANIRCAR
jgi:hypothetical protein